MGDKLESFMKFVKGLNAAQIMANLVIAIAVIFLLRRWGIKKFLSFSIITAILVFLMIQTDAYFMQTFGSEGGFFLVLVKPLFAFLIGATFVYHFFIHE